MNQNNRSRTKPAKFVFFLSVVISFLVLTLLLTAPADKASSSSQKEELADIKMVNKTSGFLVASLNRIGANRLRLELRNTYDKAITAFRLSFGKVEVTDELSYNKKRIILPNAVFTDEYPIQPTSGDYRLTVLAVVFEDGTGDGDAHAIREITGIRLGKQLAYQHFLNRITALLNSPDSQLSKSLETMRSEIANLPDDPEMSGYMRRGFNRGKQDLLADIQQAQSHIDHIRPEMERLKDHYQDLSQRYNPPKPKAPRQQ